MEVRGPRFWTGFGHDLRFFWKSIKKSSTACRSHPTSFWRRWRMDDLHFISVRSSLKCKSTSKLWNCLKLDEINEFCENVWSFVFQFVSNYVCLIRLQKKENWWCCCGRLVENGYCLPTGNVHWNAFQDVMFFKIPGEKTRCFAHLPRTVYLVIPWSAFQTLNLQ